MATMNEILRRMSEEATWSANLERQELARKVIDYYNGRQLNHLEEVIRAQFRKPDNLLIQLVMHNFVQFIGDEISRCFDSEPTITAEQPSTRVDDFLTHINNKGALQLHCKLAEVYANLARVCAIHTFFDEKRQQVDQILMPSSVLWVFQNADNPRDYEAVIYSQEYNSVGLTKTEYVHWDTEYAFRFASTSMGVYEPLAGQENINNPYGIIPFAFFRDSVPEQDFWGDISDYLINAQDTLNVMLTEKKYLEKMQSFSIPVLKGWEGKDSPIYIDPSMPIKIPASMSDEGEKDFRYETPQARLADLRESIKQHQEIVLDNFGIYTDAIKSGQSGFALKLRNRRLDRRREDGIPLMRSGLEQLLENSRIIYNAHFPEKAVPDGVEWVIDFKEPEYNEDPLLTQQVQKGLIELGQLSLSEMMMNRNPDMTSEQAAARVEENLKQWQQTKRRFGLASLLSGGSSGSGGGFGGGE